MKEEMLNDGYIFEGGQWKSPYTGDVTSFQPAREEYLIIRRITGLMHNSPRQWMRQLKDMERRFDIINKRARKQTKLAMKYMENLRAILNKTHEVAPVQPILQAIQDIARKALEPEQAEATPQPKPEFHISEGEAIHMVLQNLD